ncbi:hypothetical protein [Arthrobacter castelli]|uniref:baeRF2 domain-containing protein n=1 Tax=Arthrobacter castelli TaxID=271431 RepID=UPI0003F56BF1|nr:hypothetical protein [Arthrobacter castelli]
MKLEAIRGVYEQQGPFATVYLEGRSPSDDAGQQIRLRWDDLRGRLAEAGAEEAVLESLDDAVMVEDIAEVQTDGRILVANATGVVLNDAWDAALGAGDAAHWSAQPELGAYVREQARSVRLLVAIADQHGAVVRRLVVAESHTLDQRSERSVGSESDESAHKPREGALSHKQIQRRADEAVKQNVRGVAEHLDQAATSWKPDLVVLAGEVQGRTALRDELPKALQDHYVEIDSGGVEDEDAEEALAGELRKAAGEVSAERSEQHRQRFEQAKAHNLVAEGAQAVALAARMGAVETLLLEYDRSSSEEASLLAAAAGVDAEAGLISTQVEDAVAAVLRFEAPREMTNEENQ